MTDRAFDETDRATRSWANPAGKPPPVTERRPAGPPPAPFDWRGPALVMAAACAIAVVGFGARSIFGLFLEPMSAARGWGRETFALALAIQNLVWGASLPVAGALSDRFGPSRVLAAGAVVYALGIRAMAGTESPALLQLTAGILVGVGVAFTAFTIALAAMAKVVGPERRSLALGLGTAAGSFGQVVFSPLGQSLIAAHGWEAALVSLSATVLVIAPLALLLPGVGSRSGAADRRRHRARRRRSSRSRPPCARRWATAGTAC